MNNIKVKEKWHKVQIDNFLNKRQNSEEAEAKKAQTEIFTIRRDIKEIPGLNEISTINSVKNMKFARNSQKNMVKSPKNMVKSPKNTIINKNLSYLAPENTKKSTFFQKNSNIRQKSFFLNNIVIRKEYPKKNAESPLNPLNRSISEIVKKNDKTLEELLKYSNNVKKTQKNEFLQIFNEDEVHADKMAKIMYLHKSKRRNYSNSDLIEHSNSKISLKNMINSLKKPNYITEYDEDIANNHIIRKFSYDLQPKTSILLAKKPIFAENPINSLANMMKISSTSRGVVTTLRKKSELGEFLNKVQIKSERVSQTPVSSSCHFFSPFTSNHFLHHKRK